MGIICYHLYNLDGKMTDVWNSRLGPTAALALGITIMRAAMMIPVASSLDQLKWRWFQGTQRMDSFEHFDEASRGVLGSLRLLIELKIPHLASIGALIIIFALAIDTLAQNAIKITVHDDLNYGQYIKHEGSESYYDEGCYVFATDQYSFQTDLNRTDKTLPPPDILTFVTSALITQSFLNDLTYPLWYCITGNCQFPLYQSLAINVIYHELPVSFNETTGNYSIKEFSDLTMSLGRGIINSTADMIQLPLNISSTVGPLLARWLLLVNPGIGLLDPVGMECIYYWAVNTYQSGAVNNTFTETILSTWTNTSDRITDPHGIILTPSGCLLENTTWENEEFSSRNQSNCTYKVLESAHKAFQTYLVAPDLSVVGHATCTESDDGLLYYDYSSMFMYVMLNQNLMKNHSTIAKNILITAERLAQGLTTIVRLSPRTLLKSPNDDEYGRYYGITEWTPDAKLKIVWVFLAGPILLVVLSTVFFLATVYVTRGEAKWKSSQLAVLFHGLREEDLKDFGDVSAYADMREIGRNAQAQFIKTKYYRKKLMSVREEKT
ncbi:hypothetical protein P154DRAFT_561828 [Amniculicola lignicola CBS 123094]|uniref:Uncharacterized protein n=1 Tax=Amniculicola lignicola CBS 123094 TaxID=1392246 RepID=A0A6A5WYP5_9PLEO|nr:hypothetical protein P154DRAFT_561828 [Amniculicola lignicola CBS 123094]